MGNKRRGGTPQLEKRIVKIHCRQPGCNERVIDCDQPGLKDRLRQLRSNGFSIIRVV